uniref:DNA-repair protein Xrcc1 N-terminal domain-containing protein n=1 Tax=Setaria italica TaxID=4555 RepID=K4A4P8_SETIT
MEAAAAAAATPERETSAEWGDGVVALGFRVKASSRESPSQKAGNVLEADLRSHWSTATNTKEWILLELQEPCLLSHVRIYNKSVLEWELTAGLRYKPDAFVKVRPRCESPKRDVVYAANHTPCRYLRISCLRGNPIAIFFIQLYGIPVPGLEPELQPLLSYLLPQITSAKQPPSQNMHLQLLKDIASRLPPFLPQIEADLNSIADTPESSVRFLALLAGPFYPILHLVNERDPTRSLFPSADSDALRTSPAATPTISSNFEASKVLQKLLEPEPFLDKSMSNGVMLSSHACDEIPKSDASSLVLSTDYSCMFGEEFSLLENHFDGSFLSILDIAAVEEGILHVLYAAASQPLLCRKLAEVTSDIWSVLPLVQALLPALRPSLSPGPTEQIDDSFSQWNHPNVQHALSQVDLAVELLEGLLGIIQEAGQYLARSRAALKYVLLAISGHMDDVLTEYKEVMHKLLFILEMLDPFIDPPTSVLKDTVIFGGITAIYLEKQSSASDIALNIIRTAVKRADVLPSLELEWRRGAVAPSVILSILDPHMPLPPDIDLCRSSVHEINNASLAVLDNPAPQTCNPENIDGRDASETTIRAESFEQYNFLFAPEELNQSELTGLCTLKEKGCDVITQTSLDQDNPEGRRTNEKLSSEPFLLDNIAAADYFDAQADYQQLENYQDCELRALEFHRLALNLCMQQEPTFEGHNAGIDALLLAAECYVNPFFLLDFQPNLERLEKIERIHSELMQGNASIVSKNLHLKDLDRKAMSNLEKKRDRSVIDLLLQAARFDCEYQEKIPEGEPYPNNAEDGERSVEISQEALQFADAVTLVRKNQAMLCHFIMKQFQRKGHLCSEILLQSLLFLLHSATELFCPPENVIDIILKSAENLNEQLACLYSCVNAGKKNLDRVKVHGLRRRWTLLQKLVLASSGSDNTREIARTKRDGFRFRSLVPPSTWIQKISDFSRFSSPLPRFLGWMAVSRYAKEYLNERLFLASDFSQLTSLLSIYMDELCLMDGVSTQKVRPAKGEQSNCKHLLLKKETTLSDQRSMAKQFKILLPELHFFFPSMSRLFNAFGESILEAVGLQLKCLPNNAVPDVLCWFSELCLWPYLERIKEHLVAANRISYLRGNIAANVKAVVFYLLESIITEHMEAIIPEMPRIVHILVSLCRASYTDVAFLKSVLCLMKPLISYFLRKGTDNTKRRIEMLSSLLVWVDCISSDPPSLLCSYLQGFQTLLDGCETVLVQNIELLGVSILSATSQSVESTDSLGVDGIMQLEKNTQDSEEQILVKSTAYYENDGSRKGVYSLHPSSIIEFCGAMEKFISHLTPSIEGSWKWHHQLASGLSLSIAKCLLFANFLKSIAQEETVSSSSEQDVAVKISSELAQKHWQSALEGLGKIILANQETQCWQVASAMLDYIMSMPNVLAWGNVLSATCSAVKGFCSHAPRISWRLQTDKWLSLLVSGGIESFNNSETCLIDLFCTMLSHSEPEQRSIALQQLGRIINSTSSTEADLKSPTYDPNFLTSVSTVTSLLVTHTWDRVAALALHDSSMLLRNHAMALLTEYVPYVDRKHLQSFLASSNSILNGLGQLSGVVEEGYFTRMSLLLLSRACLYSTPGDIALLPECVWQKLENMQTSSGGFGYMEKDLCRALCQLRSESDAKTVVKEVLSGSTCQAVSPDFKSIRDSILQVMSSLSSIEAYFEFFSAKSAQENEELEEAEIELELIEKEKSVHNFVVHRGDTVVPDMPSYHKGGNDVNKRLQQVRENIRSLEKSRLKEEITVRRQKKLLIRHAREKYLEETSSREMELMQELDRERGLEMEREVERQRQLDIERAKSRELQFNLDLEKEKQTQRELQRELEQVELGRSSSRREFSANPNSRSRERYRERDGGRAQQEAGSLRSSSRGHEGGSAQATAPAGGPPVVLAGTRSFSGGNLPTILQPRDRAAAAADDDNAWTEGSRDFGDASSIGDPEFDGPRPQGPRGGSGGGKSSSSRQVVERRERDGTSAGTGRREGKWERKQHS